MMVGRDVQLDRRQGPRRAGRAVLEAEDITVIDARGHRVVKDVSFEARAGEVLGIAGVQGNGQTELIKSLLGLIKPDAGRIQLDGKDISKHGPRRESRGRASATSPRTARTTASSARSACARTWSSTSTGRRVLRAASRSSSTRSRANAEAPDRGVRHPHRVDGDAGRVAVRRQPAEGRRRARVLAAAQGADRLPADPRRRRRARSSSSTSGSSPSATRAPRSSSCRPSSTRSSRCPTGSRSCTTAGSSAPSPPTSPARSSA